MTVRTLDINKALIMNIGDYIVEMLEPYLPNQNAAEILKGVIGNSNGLRNFSKKVYIFYLDRDFRDIKEKLKIYNFKVLMPA